MEGEREKIQEFIIVGATLIGFLVWREVPDAWTLAGAAVVACAGVYMLRHGVSKS